MRILIISITTAIVLLLSSCSITKEHYKNGFMDSIQPSENFDDTNPYLPLAVGNKWVYSIEVSDGENGTWTLEVIDTDVIQLEIGGKLQKIKAYKIISESTLSRGGPKQEVYGINLKSGSMIFFTSGNKVDFISQYVPRDFNIDKEQNKLGWTVFKPDYKIPGYEEKLVYGQAKVRNLGSYSYTDNIGMQQTQSRTSKEYMFFAPETGLVICSSLVNPKTNNIFRSVMADSYIIYTLEESVIK